MDDCPLVKIRKGEELWISWSGNEECFNLHSDTIIETFSDECLTWEHDKDEPPSTVYVSPKFFKLEEDNCVLSPAVTGQDQSCDDKQTRGHRAFLHIYFIYANSLDAYRQVRPQASEWFARLCEADNPNWLIIFESSKVKDRKVRASISEKMRSDFARFPNKLVETGDFAVGPTSSAGRNVVEKAPIPQIQSALLASFSSYKDSLTEAITQMENKVAACEGDFGSSVAKLLNLRFQLCRFFWALGLLEYSLDQLADMDELLHSLLLLDGSRVQGWLRVLGKGDGRVPLLGPTMLKNRLNKDGSLIEWRCFILAHQLLANLHLLELRILASSPEEARDSPLSGTPHTAEHESMGVENASLSPLRANFATFILRCTADALRSLTEELLILKATSEMKEIQAQLLANLVWIDEIWALSSYASLPIKNFIDEDSIGSLYTSLLATRCDSVADLLPFFADQSDEQGLQELVEWSTTEEDGSLESSHPMLAKLRVALSSAAKFRDLAEQWLLDAQRVFQKRLWLGHVKFANNVLIQLCGTASREKRFNCLVENWRLNFKPGWSAPFASTPAGLKICIDETEALVEAVYEDLLEHDKELQLDLYLTLTAGSQKEGSYATKLHELFVQPSTSREQFIARSNTEWSLAPVVPFPFRIARITGGTGSAITTLLHSTISLEVDIQTSLPLNPESCTYEVVAVFRTVDWSGGEFMPNIPAFESRQYEQASQRGDIARRASLYRVDRGSALNAVSAATNGNTRIRLATKTTHLGVPIKLEGKASHVGCFALSRIEIWPSKNLVFHLDYHAAMQMPSTSRQLEPLLCLVELEKPTMELEAVDGPRAHPHDSSRIPQISKVPLLYAGVVQHARLRLKYSGQAVDSSTGTVKVSQVRQKGTMEFLASDGKWANEAEYLLDFKRRGPPSDCNEESGTYSLDFHLFLPIEGMNFSVDQQALESQREIEVEWLEHKWLWHFPVVFKPLLNMKSSTSLLCDRVLFELHVQRGGDTLQEDILPLEAELFQDQSIAKEPVEALLLNPKPLQPICASSAYQFVWQLPTSKIGASIPITHFIRLKYRVKAPEQQGLTTSPVKEAMKDRDYYFDNTLTFAVQKVEYEVCAHVLSERPNLVLCRIDLPCELIVSLRSLTNRAESIIVAVEVDQQYWAAVEKYKVVNIKESGVGQTSFPIIPRKIGFLPYPLIYIHRLVSSVQNGRHSLLEPSMFGERLTSFHRNQGKQIHVLGPLLNPSGGESTGSIGGSSSVSSTSTTKKSLKSQAKDKIQKLFE